MSRFEEVVNEAIGEVVLGEQTFRAETLAEHIAQLVRERQGARRAEVTVEARFPEHKPAPVSRHPHPGALHAARRRGGHRARHPPADRRHRPGHDRVPVRPGAGRRQRARAARGRGLRRRRDRADPRGGPGRHPQPARPGHAVHRLPGDCARRRSTPRRCVQIVEQSMSSEIYELMKRSDEGARRGEGPPPAAVRRGLRARDGRAASSTQFPALDDDAFVLARQVNLETIHQHNVVAERTGTMREIREELRTGETAPVHTSLQAWLGRRRRRRRRLHAGDRPRASRRATQARDAPGPHPGPRAAPARGRRLRGVPHRPAPARRRDRGPQAAGRARPPDRRPHRGRPRATASRGWASPTATCRYCRTGRENLCVNARFTGRDIDGGYAELTVADERFCLPLPDGLPDEQLAPLLCGGLIGYRALRMTGDAERLGLYGFGSAAHQICQVAVHQGRDGVRVHARRATPAPRSSPARWAPTWAGGATRRRPSSWTPRSSSPRRARSSPPRSRRWPPAAPSSAPASTCPTSPSFPYEDLWHERSIRSVANLTREDGHEFLALAPGGPGAHDDHHLPPGPGRAGAGRPARRRLRGHRGAAAA